MEPKFAVTIQFTNPKTKSDKENSMSFNTEYRFNNFIIVPISSVGIWLRQMLN